MDKTDKLTRICATCNVIVSQTTYRDHMRTSHPKQSYLCECGMGYSTEKELSDHFGKCEETKKNLLNKYP